MNPVKEIKHECLKCHQVFVSNQDVDFYCMACSDVPNAIKKLSQRTYGRVVA